MVRPTSGEAPFDHDEVFFSRTDRRGVIRSGSYVFARVTGYDWDEMIGAPHKIMRHPDMPKGVFWLLWNTIEQGKAIGTYMKSQAKDGLHYWDFSAVIPCEDGYLSARIKPCSDVFELAKTEYEALLQLEKDRNLTPEASAQVLLERLAAHGFESYEQFESHAVSEELMALDKVNGIRCNGRIREFRNMLTAAQELREITDALVSEFEAVRIIPHNMRVMASRLEPTGGPFNTLSGNYGAMSLEMSQWFENNVVGENSNFSTISASVMDSMLVECIVQILLQCDSHLQSERRSLGEFDIDVERAVLKDIAAGYRLKSEASQVLVLEEARRIGIACKAMNRHVLGLSTTRVLCKIESARMGAAGEGLADIIGQLGRFQEKIGKQLEKIVQLSADIQAAAQR